MLSTQLVDWDYRTNGILDKTVNWLRQRDRLHAPRVPLPFKGTCPQRVNDCRAAALQHPQRAGPATPQVVATAAAPASTVDHGGNAEVLLAPNTLLPWLPEEDALPESGRRDGKGALEANAASWHQRPALGSPQGLNPVILHNTLTSAAHGFSSRPGVHVTPASPSRAAALQLQSTATASDAAAASAHAEADGMRRSGPMEEVVAVAKAGALWTKAPPAAGSRASRPHAAALLNPCHTQVGKAGVSVDGRADTERAVQLLQRPRPAARSSRSTTTARPAPAAAVQGQPSEPHPPLGFPRAATSGWIPFPTDPRPQAARGPGPSEAPSGAALIAAIRAAATLDKLADLYERCQRSFGSRHVSAALSRMPHAREVSYTSRPSLRDPRHEWLLGRLLERFERHRMAGEYGPRELSACAWVLGKFGRRERAVLVAELAAHMLALQDTHLQQHKQQQQQAVPLAVGGSGGGLHAAALRYDAGIRALGPQPGTGGAPLTHQPVVPIHLNGWEPQQGHQHPVLSRPIGGAGDCLQQGATGHTAPQPVPPVLLTGTAPVGAAPGCPSPCCDLDISNMALGLAKVGVTDPGIWRRLVTVAQPRLSTYGTQEVANLVWAVAQAHRAALRETTTTTTTTDDADAGIGAGGGTGQRAAAWQPWLSQFVEDAVAPLVQRALPRFAKPELVIVAWALAALGHRDVRTQAVVAAEAVARAKGLTPQGICMVVWALATMSQRPGGGRARGAAEGSGRARGLSIAQAKGLIRPKRTALREAAALARDENAQVGLRAPGVAAPTATGVNPQEQRLAISQRELRVIAKAAAIRIRRFSPQGLSNLLWGLRVLGLHGSYRLLSLAVRETVHRLPSLEPLGLATLVETWAQARLYHTRLFTAVVPVVLERMRDFHPATLVRLLVAYATVGHRDRRLFVAAAVALLKPTAQADARGGGASLDAPGAAAAASLASCNGGIATGDTVGGYRDGGGASQGRSERGGSGQTRQATAAGPSPLDGLSYRELHLLVCAYGQAGVHVPQLLDELLLRMRRLTPAGWLMHPRAACHLVSALAVLDHRPPAMQGPAGMAHPILRSATPPALRSHPTDAAAADVAGLDGETAAAARAAKSLVRRARKSVLAGLSRRSVPAPLGVWALLRLGVEGPAAALRLVGALTHRVVAAGEAATPAAALQRAVDGGSCHPALVSRLVLLLGQGAATALSFSSRAPDIGSGVAARDLPAPGAAGRLAFKVLPYHDEAAAEGRPDGAHGRAAEADDHLALGIALSRALEIVCRTLVGSHLRTIDRRVLAALVEALAAVSACAPPRSCAEAGDSDGGADVSKRFARLHRCLVEAAEEALRRGVLSPAAALPEPAAVSQARARPVHPERGTALAAGDAAAVVHAICDSGLLASRPLLVAPAARLVLRALVLAEATAYGCALSTRPAAVQSLTGPGSRGTTGSRQLRLACKPRVVHRQSRPHEPRSQLPIVASVEDVARLLAAASRLGLYDEAAAQPFLRSTVLRLTRSRLGCSPAGLQTLLRYCRPLRRRRLSGEAGDQEDEEGAGGGDYGMAGSEAEGEALRNQLYGWAVRQALGVLPWLDPRARLLVTADGQAGSGHGDGAGAAWVARGAVGHGAGCCGAGRAAEQPGQAGVMAAGADAGVGEGTRTLGAAPDGALGFGGGLEPLELPGKGGAVRVDTQDTASGLTGSNTAIEARPAVVRSATGAVVVAPGPQRPAAEAQRARSSPRRRGAVRRLAGHRDLGLGPAVASVASRAVQVRVGSHSALAAVLSEAGLAAQVMEDASGSQVGVGHDGPAAAQLRPGLGVEVGVAWPGVNDSLHRSAGGTATPA